MSKIRLCAALWAMTTIILSFLLFLLSGGSAIVSAAMTIAALVLAAPAPFMAKTRAARVRVALAAMAYVVGLSGAIVLGYLAEMRLMALALIGLFALVGLGLAGWAWTTRNRRPKPGWAGYYDSH